MTSTQDQTEVAAAPRHWYTELHPVFLDVAGDFAGTELSIVDGDALLSLVCRDFSDLAQPNLLHGVYAVEDILSKLVQAKSVFEVVFFQDRKNMDNFPIDESLQSRKLATWRGLFRGAVIAHLRKIKQAPVHVFDSIRGDVWATYIQTRKPLYILTEDGSHVPRGDKSWSADVDRLHQACRQVWLESMWLHLHNSMSVVLMSKDMFVDNKVVSFVFHATKRIFDLAHAEEHAQTVVESCRLLDAAVQKDSSDNPVASITNDLGVVANALAKMIPTLTPLHLDFAKIFLLQANILPTTPLELRARPDVAPPVTKECSNALEDFLRLFYATASTVADDSADRFVDTVDERFYLTLLSEVSKSIIKNGSDIVDGAVLFGVEKNVEAMWNAICPTGNLYKYTALSQATDKAAVSVEPPPAAPKQRALPLLPYHQPFLEQHLPKLPAAAVSESDSSLDSDFIPIYETSRWNVAKPAPVVVAPKSTLPSLASRFPPKPQRMAGKVRKAEQRQASFIQKYAMSLTGVGGKLIKPKVIVVQPKGHSSAKPVRHTPTPTGSDTEPPTPSKGKGKPGSGGGKKIAAPSKKDAIIAANMERQANTEKELAAKRWAMLREKVENMGHHDLSIAELKRALNDEKSIFGKALVNELKLFMVMFLLKKWASFCVSASNPEDPASPERKEEGIEVLVEIFQLCSSILASSEATKAIVEETQRVLKKVGLEQPERISDSPDRPSSSRGDKKKEKDSSKSKSDKGSKAESKDKKAKGPSKIAKKDEPKVVADDDADLSFKFAFPRGLPTSSALKSPHNLTTFQLLYCGERMEKSMGESGPDPRVDFQPDAWQKKTLDAIDRNDSVFVVAPTSAGKTFIAYYAIEKVLRESDSGVIVYVAPTKALVNQIAAEISARFSKSYQYAGTSVWAVHTRDYKIHEPTRAQILVTVPHILQILMLQPDVTALWTPRLKCIIFDEIHSVARMDEGVVWEQNLMLCPCPIIALSATVGNPDEFAQWLQDLQAAKGHKLEMIRHAHRYSDLRKFVYAPQEFHAFKGLDDRALRNKTSIVHLHPIAALSLGLSTIPDDMHLESHECLMLYEAMHFESDDKAVLPPNLNPEKYFANLPIIKKSDIIAYQAELKSVLEQWMALPDARTSGAFSRVLKRLSKNIDGALKKTHDLYYAETKSSPVGLDYALKNVMALCHDLHRSGKLPAILFNYSRDHVEALALQLYEELDTAEANYKSTDGQWKRKVEAWESWKVAEVKRKAAMEKTKNAAAGEDDEPQDEGDAGWQASFDPTDPLPQFSFTGKSNMATYEINKDISSLEWYGVDPKLCLALRRGVGVHHAGMNLRYRQIVERYFRAGFLRVVVATGTLALGINMPASTSVFTEDSVFLTALEFRQAAGRAGRRGFDLLGNVVFFGIPLHKVYRLLASRLPSLSGHFPLSTTLVLRLHQLLGDEKSRKIGEEMFTAILSQNRVSLGCEAAKMEVLHHLRFSIEYLRRRGLLSEIGKPIHLSALTQYLYDTEPMNLNFAFLLNSGVLVAVLKKSSNSELTLLTVLAHLFGRRRLPANMSDFREELIKRSPSKVFLEPLPPAVVKVLKTHNDLVFEVMSSYIKHYVETLDHEDTAKLPLSGKSYPKAIEKAETSQSPFMENLANTALKYTARSPFVALSGFDDTFASVKELSQTLRSGVTLQASVVPMVSELLDDSIVLDSYVVDFYQHGQFKALVDGNGIRRGDVWQMLKDFHVILNGLRHTMEALLLTYKKAELKKLGQIEDEVDVLKADGGVPEEEEDYENEDDEDNGNLEETRKWSPILVIEPHLRDRRVWDIYVVLCKIQREFGEKMEAQAA
ncbi:hypothetical protein PhCBS80983_g04932 [Powellomyces hirtus]|uniref:P-loop containing nucleoside triphosphate hydrolase protein n=1 Tax=Powellomyces hirtus TaxID=109895 RepID=A0A507DYJ4_9FUNG|nr:hypothetical protein PhCBS80983_g04932 [Powellomyces hirtus]